MGSRSNATVVVWGVTPGAATSTMVTMWPTSFIVISPSTALMMIAPSLAQGAESPLRSAIDDCSYVPKNMHH